MSHQGLDWGVLNGDMEQALGVLGNGIYLRNEKDVLDLSGMYNPQNGFRGLTIAFWIKIKRKMMNSTYIEACGVFEQGTDFKIKVSKPEIYCSETNTDS